MLTEASIYKRKETFGCKYSAALWFLCLGLLLLMAHPGLSVGTSVEHHSLYQYQLANTRAVFMGQIQSETAYYQPNPDASLPFAPNAELLDPKFSSSCNNGTGQCSGWGLNHPGLAGHWGLWCRSAFILQQLQQL